jgi:hypothetical protein
LRNAARRAVIAADPSAARRRKERAQQDARVERWDEHAGTAALAGNLWCVTFTDPRGRPVAHGCARAGPRAGRRNARPVADGPTAGEHTARPLPGSGAAPGLAGRPGGPDPPPGPRWTFAITLFDGSGCDHAWQTSAYRPSPTLRHLVEVRHDTCVFPGC